MGLNTNLKCGRLGPVGRPLSIIAQELRSYANLIAMEASEVNVSLRSVLTIASSLSGGKKEQRSLTWTSYLAYASSVAGLRAAGESLANASATLAFNTEGVGQMLSDTVARATIREELARELRQAAAALVDLATSSDDGSMTSTAEVERMLELFLPSYTMEGERIIHDRCANGKSGAVAPTAKPSPSLQAPPVDFENTQF